MLTIILWTHFLGSEVFFKTRRLNFLLCLCMVCSDWQWKIKRVPFLAYISPQGKHSELRRHKFDLKVINKNFTLDHFLSPVWNSGPVNNLFLPLEGYIINYINGDMTRAPTYINYSSETQNIYAYSANSGTRIYYLKVAMDL